MSPPAKILLQTTIVHTDDDWAIWRFGMLADYLRSLTNSEGHALFEVTARDRDAPGRPDTVLSTLDQSDYQALWLFAVDSGDGLTPQDCAAIGRFHQRGGGTLITRDHMNLGCSVSHIAGIGAAHHFHTVNVNPDTAFCADDDCFTTSIHWPNFHSGANGNFQQIQVEGPLHPVLTDPASADGQIHFLPAHPHEGDVHAPPDAPTARVIASGVSAVTQARFNIAVAFEASPSGGRAIAESTFHHFVDYNWDIARGAPSFVTEAAGDRLAASPEAQRSVHQYVKNVALWLVNRPTDAELQHVDQLLDEALRESLPASEPPALG